MKKLLSLALALVLVCSCAAALAEISLRKGDLSLNRGLNQNVNHILILIQDGEATDTLLIASVNSRTGRAVLTELRTDVLVDVYEEPDAPGLIPIGEVYALGTKKCRGMLAMKKINELLNLNVNNYVAMDLSLLADIAKLVGGVQRRLTPGEAAALGLPEGETTLEGETLVEYARIELEDDYDHYNRCYVVLLELLEKGFHSDMSKLMSAGKKLLDAMDTNVGVMNAVLLANTVGAGSERIELDIPQDEHILGENPLTVDNAAMAEWLYKEIYE